MVYVTRSQISIEGGGKRTINGHYFYLLTRTRAVCQIADDHHERHMTIVDSRILPAAQLSCSKLELATIRKYKLVSPPQALRLILRRAFGNVTQESDST